MIKVVHFQTGITASGSSVLRLHKLMLKNGIDSTVFCATTTEYHQTIHSFSKLKLKFYALQNTIENKYLDRLKVKSFRYPFVGFRFDFHKSVQHADVIYLHWTQGGLLSYWALEKILKLNKPVILSFRDSWYMTGGCHVPLSCEKYYSGCNHCPCLKQPAAHDLAFRQYHRKLNLYRKFPNIVLLAPSRWMEDSMKKSTIVNSKEIFRIGNVIDNSIYKEQSALQMRAEFGLPSEKTLFLFGSVSPTSNRNKGWELLVEALKMYIKNYDSDFELVVFGTAHDSIFESYFDCKVNFVGEITEEEKLALLYPAVNVFLTPSLSESFGNTVLEAESCGIPVVAFNYSGVCDIVDHCKNGYLAEYMNVVDFAAGIKYCIENELKGYLKKELLPTEIMSKHFEMINKIAINTNKELR